VLPFKELQFLSLLRFLLLVFALRGHVRHRCLVAVAEGVVLFSAYPQSMHQHRQLARYGDGRSFLGAPASSRRQFLAVATQVAVHTEAALNVVRALNQQPSKQLISCFGDSSLRIAVP